MAWPLVSRFGRFSTEQIWTESAEQQNGQTKRKRMTCLRLHARTF